MRWRPIPSRWRAAIRGAVADVFGENPVLPCARCHKAGATAARRVRTCRSSARKNRPEYLLESIIKPSAHIAQGFDIVTFQLKNGETETGSVASESATEIALKRADGTALKIDPKQVKAAHRGAVVHARDLRRRCCRARSCATSWRS